MTVLLTLSVPRGGILPYPSVGVPRNASGASHARPRNRGDLHFNRPADVNCLRSCVCSASVLVDTWYHVFFSATGWKKEKVMQR